MYERKHVYMQVDPQKGVMYLDVDRSVSRFQKDDCILAFRGKDNVVSIFKLSAIRIKERKHPKMFMTLCYKTFLSKIIHRCK